VGTGRMVLWTFCTEAWLNFATGGRKKDIYLLFGVSRYVHRYTSICNRYWWVIRTEHENRGLYRAGVRPSWMLTSETDLLPLWRIILNL
jgi:hypothetical protein